MRRRSAKRLIVAANEVIMKRLKTKEEEITRLNHLNRSLEEKLKSLLMENQIWRELAQTNEATTYNLQQLLAQAQLQQQEQEQILVNDDDIDDGESGCGSNYEEHVNRKCVECGKKESCPWRMYPVSWVIQMLAVIDNCHGMGDVSSRKVDGWQSARIARLSNLRDRRHDVS
nr:probable BOI-related E3 ubiquitin-protein ligase 3 [Tanacetum cinerariifolium]